ncbi:General stress protein 14 [Kingella potus]|uniref:General stress protein 14 n=1 Tax=Kingella potus TaxID=265175 RepID=A0A377R0P1_9NEIS|nr:NAD(P)H-dependent oxidoreductase [Kingella potus]UOP01133.1 NAD(P)H-dependent oxidoreductase [Kingella potus]STR00837.1 General stress protein 14 [Kingella potus]
MQKTLILAAHPNLAASVVNRRWLAELDKHSGYTVHQLYPAYPDGKIDTAAEQCLVEAHDRLVLQFPVYWFSCPPLLKQWFDDVLTYGWAYGSQGKALQDKTVALAVSLGAPAADYRAEGKIGCPLTEVLRPFELTMRYCNADYRPPFTFHTIDSNAAYDDAARALIDQSAADYLEWLKHLS